MFIAGIEFFFGLVAGLILLILGIKAIKRIGTSAVEFWTKGGEASTFTIVVWSVLIVCLVGVIGWVFGFGAK